MIEVPYFASSNNKHYIRILSYQTTTKQSPEELNVLLCKAPCLIFPHGFTPSASFYPQCHSWDDRGFFQVKSGSKPGFFFRDIVRPASAN